MKKFAFIICLVSALAFTSGCTATWPFARAEHEAPVSAAVVPPVPSPSEQETLFRRQIAKAMRTYSDPDTRIAALSAIVAPNAVADVYKEARIAITSLEAGSFAKNSSRLRSATRGIPLYRLDRATQAITYLAHKVIGNDGVEVASRSVRTLVDRYCSPLDLAALPRGSLSAEQIAERRFVRSLSEGCFAFASGDSHKAEVKIFYALVMADAERRLLYEIQQAGFEKSPRLAVKWFEWRLDNEGLSLASLKLVQ